MGAEQLHDPEFQVGNGCQIDQLVGDAAARLAGLPSVFDPVHVTSALRAVHEENYVARAGWWSNPMRTFFTNRDEATSFAPIQKAFRRTRCPTGRR